MRWFAILLVLLTACRNNKQLSDAGADAGSVVDGGADAQVDALSADSSVDGDTRDDVVARVDIIQSGALFERPSQEIDLSAVACNAAGEILDVEISWQLSPTSAVAEVGRGRFRATNTVGSGLVWAVAAGIRSAPVPVVNARVAPEVVRYDDGAVLGVDALNPPGSDGAIVVARFTTEPSFDEGSIIVGTGGSGAIGRVLAATPSRDGFDVRLAPVGLDELFSEYLFEGEDGLGALTPGLTGAFADKRLGVSCSVAGVESELGRLLVMNTSRVTEWPNARWTFSSETQEVRFQGRLGVELGVTAELGFTPGLEWTCLVEMYSLPLPILPLPWSLAFAVEAPVGIRLDVEASADAADVSVGVSASTGVDLDVGFRCQEGAACTSFHESTLVPASWEPSLSWSSSAQVEATVFTGPYISLWAGIPVVGREREDRPGATFAVARAGARLHFVKAGIVDQLDDPELAGKVSIELGGDVTVGVSNPILVDIFDWSLELFSDETWVDWQRTPTGRLALRHLDAECGDEPTLREGCSIDLSVDWDNTTEVDSVVAWQLYQKVEGGDWERVGEADPEESLRWDPSAVAIEAGRVTFGALYTNAWLPGGLGRMEIADDSPVEIVGIPRLCGNSEIDDGEECDGSNLGTSRCDGGLACAADCRFDVSMCARTGYSTLAMTNTSSACAISAGQVVCWGANDLGQRGIGMASDLSSWDVPTTVPGLDSVVEITGYGSGYFALRSDGTVAYWGSRQLSGSGYHTEASPINLDARWTSGFADPALPVVPVANIARVQGSFFLRADGLVARAIHAGSELSDLYLFDEYSVRNARAIYDTMVGGLASLADGRHVRLNPERETFSVGRGDIMCVGNSGRADDPIAGCATLMGQLECKVAGYPPAAVETPSPIADAISMGTTSFLMLSEGGDSWVASFDRSLGSYAVAGWRLAGCESIGPYLEIEGTGARYMIRGVGGVCFVDVGRQRILPWP